MTVPAGYTALGAGARRAIVRDDLVPALGPWLVRKPLAPPAGATPLGGGRGGTFRVELGTGGAVVLRFGHRGGVVARLVRARYLGMRPRPWRELVVSLAARARGAPVPEVVAVGVHGWGIYRSVVVTGELAGVTPLLAALRAAPPGGPRAAVAHAAGVAVAELHDAGVRHPDLNLSNIVVAGDTASIVDLDRARVVAGGLAPPARRRSLRRLARSVRKLDPRGEVVDAAVRRSFHDAYGRGPACGS